LVTAPVPRVKNSARSVGSQRRCAAGLVEFDANLSGTDSGAIRVNTPVLPLSVRVAAHRCRTSLV